VARGGHVTPRTAVQALAKQTRRVLGTPQHRVQALRRHNHLERKFHGRVGRGIVRPHVSYGRGRRHVGRRYSRARYGVPAMAVGRPGVVRAGSGGVVGPAAGGRAGLRSGRVVGGHCTCPTCGSGPGGAAAAPAYCRCCGQVIR
jgi:hypothetical protein